ncbi:MAG: PQQ-dependent sugar dehydrogenase [Phycisphaerales bacterium JB063]
MKTRTLIPAIGLAAISVALPATHANAQSQVPLGSEQIQLVPLVDGLNGVLTGNTANDRPQLIPVDMTPLGDGRHLVLTLTGHVRLLQADGTLAPGAFLDTYNVNSPPPFGSPGTESDFRQIGNTSIAAHPGFLDPNSRGYGRFYVVTTELAEVGVPNNNGEDADFFDGVGSIVDNVITEWTIDPSAISGATQLNVSGPNANVTQREVMRSQRPGIIHTLADIAFTPDEYLIITSGDGGGNAFPNTDGSAFNQDRFTNAQDPRNIFGSVLRIDPLALGSNDSRPTGGRFDQYYIHPDNFGNTDGDPDTHAETFAYGLRSPYRISVDQVTGQIFIGDVGEGAREEINLIVNGGNYGWGAYEGTALVRPDLLPDSDEPQPIGPVWELYHNLPGGINEANNVVGGFIYRGTELEGLQGMYIFADTGEDNDGEPNNVIDIYYGDLDAANGDARTGLQRFQIVLPEDLELPDRIWSMAEDENGELYLLVGPDRLDFFNLEAGETDGGIWRITAVPEPGSLALLAGMGACLLQRRRRAA